MAIDALRSYLQLASGLTDVTRERAKAAAQALVSGNPLEGGTSAVTAFGTSVTANAGALADDLVAASKANRKLLIGLIRSEVDRAVHRLGLATGDEVDALSERVARLEGTPSAGSASTAKKAPAARKSAAKKTPAKKSVAKKSAATTGAATTGAATTEAATTEAATTGPATTEAATTEARETEAGQPPVAAPSSAASSSAASSSPAPTIATSTNGAPASPTDEVNP
jgi:hypothetical protein